MRITLDIGDDVLRAAEERARRENKTVGAVISELARTAVVADFGLRPFPRRGGIVTNEMVEALRKGDVY